ncbi:MAG: response regulator transcription factor [Epsilonproteobacteria bacterium]|nr:response regulator transcription factor [Campylobacterota bacterium]
MKILLLEDDIALGETIEELLCESGYKVDYVTTGNSAIDSSYENKYDLYIFDINVPDIDGLDILKSLRDADDMTPTIFISAMTDLKTVLKGFEVGGSDFIKKPFFPEELLVKVDLKLAIGEEEIIFNDIIYIPKNKKIVKNGESIYLSQVQLKLFELFINNTNRIIIKDELYECLEKPSENALRFHINKLKKSTGLDIKNIRGSGYRVEKS